MWVLKQVNGMRITMSSCIRVDCYPEVHLTNENVYWSGRWQRTTRHQIRSDDSRGEYPDLPTSKKIFNDLQVY